MPNKVKIAMLGGGVSSMTAAWYLSHVPDWDKHFDITVYQVGWRLGGKGASGRNQAIADRVEEHGFHFWWGFYNNAFRFIQDAYSELNRSADSPMPTWRDAFKPIDYRVDMYFFGNQWVPRFTPLQVNDWTPGVDEDKVPTVEEYISLLLKLLLDAITDSTRANFPIELSTDSDGITKHSLWDSVLTEITSKSGEITARALLSFSHKLSVLHTIELPGFASDFRYKVIEFLVSCFTRSMWGQLEEELKKEQNFETYTSVTEADIACGIIKGLIRDDIVNKGYDIANELDFTEWLQKRGGISEISAKSTNLRAIYDLVFAYEDGVTPNLEAGTALRTVLRMLLATRGPFIWRMDGGMGDTVFAPIYEVLKKRGVKFKFFHKVESLHLSSNGNSIDKIKISKQVNVLGDEYQPLIFPKGLPSWPSEPLYDQLLEGSALKERIVVDGYEQPRYNLESFWTSWQDVDHLVLKQGVDFDVAVLGTSLAPLRWLCHDIIENKDAKWDKWRNMLHHVKTVQTQAFQLWVKCNVADLGQPFGAQGETIFNGYDVGNTFNSTYSMNLVDSWADMSHVINWETWKPAQAPLSILYFVSAIQGPDLFSMPDVGADDFPKHQFAKVKQSSLDFLRNCIYPVWPNAVRSTANFPGCFDWGLLVDTQNREGEKRFDSQYWRANVNPSDRYVLAVKGSSKYRLKTDETGCDNLYLTGDFIKNGANAGFVESAVISGILTSQTITKKLLGKRFPKEVLSWPDAPQP